MICFLCIYHTLYFFTKRIKVYALLLLYNDDANLFTAGI
uniref:Uncharacterized protein n=1 Tax=Anguilla anguilla TaxID=7936 RepID=A0A0E9RA18_ANGAN